MDSKIFADAITLMCTYAYIDSLNYRDNIITLRGPHDIQVSPRKIIDHDVYQLPGTFLTEIRKSVEKKKKRGYALVGLPGTGKTTIVDKIVDEMRNIPVLYIPSDPSKDPDVILRSLMMCQMVSPCIVVLEDVDSLPLHHKDSNYLNVFIEYLDSAKFDAPVIFLATMNEPENIHESLMDRRGRFDKVMVVTPPNTKEHVLEVFCNIYRREVEADMPDGLLSDDFYELASKSELRHSDFAEIINRVLINDMPMVQESFMEVLVDICTTQQIVNEFKRRKKGVVNEKSELPLATTSSSSCSWEFEECEKKKDHGGDLCMSQEVSL
jgi:SpoVK/Ycf46/Vps4 family AAA+-type ATPase